jgi:predicted esterase
MRYILSQNPSENLVVALHGYQDSAQSMLRRLGWTEADLPFQWLALNAPFPVPVWNADGFKEAYSWYFRDSERNLVLVKPSTTAERVAALIKDLGFERRPVVFFGFSQGGYLAPHVAKHLAAVRGIVGLGCGYTQEGYENLKPTAVWGLHGGADERISIEKARHEHAAVMQAGFTGAFIEIPNLAHKVDATAEPMVRELIERSFKENA